MVSISVCYTIKTMTGFHIGTGYGLAGVVDEKTVRGGDEFIYIPGSSIKGRLKVYYLDLAKNLGLTVCEDGSIPDCPLCKVFGSLKCEGKMIFDDAKLMDREKWRRLDKENYRDYILPLFEHTSRTNVRLSRRHKVAWPRHLFTNEMGSSGLCFEGVIRGTITPITTLGTDSLPLEAVLLVGALKLVTHLGGAKSRGLGYCSIEPSRLDIDNSPFIDMAKVVSLLEGVQS